MLFHLYLYISNTVVIVLYEMCGNVSYVLPVKSVPVLVAIYLFITLVFECAYSIWHVRRSVSLCPYLSISGRQYSSCAPGGYRDEDFHVKPPGQTVATTIPHIFTLRTGHRVDRVLGFLSSRPNWGSPTPSHSGECVSLTGCRPPPSFLYAREGSQKPFERGNYPLLPTGIGERFSQTISNLGHSALLRRYELPL
jgi:hypothetical protein